MNRFKNKIALVTGAGSGIGRSTAVRLDQEGATLIIADINEDQLNETKNMLTNKASSAMVLDISDLEQTQACFQTVKKEYKTLDALINVAGILRF
ncbi:SDR family oxidoreductase, partial [Gammaproteobacteria bacterium]|nr:SDR family oxidoreductase [Gammaproteobacteria bacterium]